MSDVNLIFIHENNVYYARVHYRLAQALLENKTLLYQFIEGLRGSYLDSGYIIVDLDEDEIVNRQNAFAL